MCALTHSAHMCRIIYALLSVSGASIRPDNPPPLVGLGSTSQSAVQKLSGSNKGKCDIRQAARSISFFFLLLDCGISRFNLLRLDLRHGLSLAVHRLGSGLQNAIYRILSKREGHSRMMLYPCFGRISSFLFSLGCFHPLRQIVLKRSQSLFSRGFRFLRTLTRASFPKRRYRHLKAK